LRIVKSPLNFEIENSQKDAFDFFGDFI